MAADYTSMRKLWNEANKATRQNLLEAAGYSRNATHYARAFPFLPSMVREDLIYTENRKNPMPPTQSKPKQTWQPYKD